MVEMTMNTNVTKRTNSTNKGRSTMSGRRSMTVLVETAERDLKDLLEQLQLGETITLITPDGMPLALVVSLKPLPVEVGPASDWEARWDALTQKVSQAWKSDKSAVEILTEMRR
jgi:antitoxin (DNA-binding transcriptional repressor) of toxin-antitoxin stability system